jgi:hypothetical protein
MCLCVYCISQNPVYKPFYHKNFISDCHRLEQWDNGLKPSPNMQIRKKVVGSIPSRQLDVSYSSYYAVLIMRSLVCKSQHVYYIFAFVWLKSREITGSNAADSIFVLMLQRFIFLTLKMFIIKKIMHFSLQFLRGSKSLQPPVRQLSN